MNVLYLLLQRILEEDEEIEQEKIKQTLDLQFHKQRQSLHSMDQEKQTYTMRAATICGQAINIPKATTPPVHCIQDHSLPTEFFHEQGVQCVRHWMDERVYTVSNFQYQFSSLPRTVSM